jgi:TM2 domain-containing membrane protein YozV
MMFCTNCGNEVHEKAVACPKCGVPPREENKYCYNCAVELNPTQVTCIKCGVAVGKKNSAQLSGNGQKNKITAVLFAVFLGAFGAHKFYLGSWGWGLVYLLGVFVTCGCGALITGPAALIEWIIYLTMDDAKFAEKYNETPPHPFKW